MTKRLTQQINRKAFLKGLGRRLKIMMPKKFSKILVVFFLENTLYIAKTIGLGFRPETVPKAKI